MTASLAGLSRTLSVVTTALVLACSMVVALAHPVGADDDAVVKARREADAAAADLAAARTELGELDRETARVAARAASAASRIDELRGALRTQAVDRFVGAAAPGTIVWPLLRADDIGAGLRAGVLAEVVGGTTDGIVDEYRSLAEDLTVAERHLAELGEETAVAVDRLDDRAGAATVELDRQVALAAERRRAAEAARRDAERATARRAAVAASQPATEAAVAPRGEADPPAADLRPVATAPSPDAPSPADAPARAAAPAPVPAPAAAPAPTPAPEPAGGFVCPVAGAVAFTNDWGQPRSGGRRHQGTDLLSPRGTPVVASSSGTVRGHQSSLGGVSYYLEGDDGNTYLGTHLDSLSGAAGRVDRGAVLGWVGNSGNARGGPTHLHFEVHPGGGGPTNPYPILSGSC